jgi:signal transduction histidine kinase
VTFERKIYLAFSMVIVGILPVAIVSFLSIQEVISDEDSLVSIHSRASLLTEQLRYMNSTQSSMVPIFVLSGDDRLVDSFDKRQMEFNQVAEELSDLVTDQTVKNKISDIVRLSTAQHAVAKPGIQMRKNGFSVEEVHDYFAKSSRPISLKLNALLKNLAETESRELQDAKSRTAQTVQHTMRALIFLSIFSAIALATIGRLLVKVMIQRRAFDKTQAELMEHEQRLSQARKETVEVVAHDLKNPLGSIKMSLEILKNSPSISQLSIELREVLNIVDRSTHSMENLITNLLDHSKIESGNLILEDEACDLADLLEQQALLFAPHAVKKRISLELEVPNDAVVVQCDALRIEQVISNLLGNALKFTPEGGRVRIKFETSGERAIVAVEDNGPGLKPHEIPRLFDRFWQARATAHHGTGLGLAITKAIVEAHQGAISVEVGPGGGSRFVFWVPIRRQNSTGKTPQAAAKLKQDTRSDEPPTTDVTA